MRGLLLKEFSKVWKLLIKGSSVGLVSRRDSAIYHLVSTLVRVDEVPVPEEERKRRVPRPQDASRMG